MEPVELPLSPEDWDQVMKRLWLKAVALVPPDACVRGLGDGPEDLVKETILRLWDPSTPVKWNHARYGPPTVQSLVTYLSVVLKNLFRDRLRRGSYTHSSADEIEEEQGSRLAERTANPVEEHRLLQLYVGELCEKTLAIAEGEDDAEVVLYLELQIRERGRCKNAEAAAELGLAAADVVNLRKRLARYVLRVRRGHLAATASPLE